MSTISAFNDMMEQFLEELVQTFPEEQAMKKFQMSFEILRKANSRACMENFMRSVKPYASQIMAKDAAFFLENEDVLKDFSLKSIWTDDISTGTKDAIWQYLQTLYMLGMTISALPEDALASLEQMAIKCAKDMKPGDLDPSTLMSGVSSMLMQGLSQKKS
jgi:hypothetical protein